MDAPRYDRRSWSGDEIRARQKAGAPEIAPVIRTFATEQHRDFFARLPLAFVAGLDAAGRPVASLLRGAPGFIALAEPRRMEIAARFPECEPLTREMDEPFGVIGMDFAARRRNRVNGRIVVAESGRLTISVEEAFGNCPKYIAPRDLFSGEGDPGAWRVLPAVDAEARALIEGSDIFFVATRGADGIDMSHRGGPPGFVRLTPEGELAIPDFRGNNYFNTFGNLLHDPRAALLFVDFPRGRVLHLQGVARVDFSPVRSWSFAPENASLLMFETALGSASGVAP